MYCLCTQQTVDSLLAGGDIAVTALVAVKVIEPKGPRLSQNKGTLGKGCCFNIGRQRQRLILEQTRQDSLTSLATQKRRSTERKTKNSGTNISPRIKGSAAVVPLIVAEDLLHELAPSSHHLGKLLIIIPSSLQCNPSCDKVKLLGSFEKPIRLRHNPTSDVA